ncbi:MAG: hypothetical protein RL326_878 [Pseudomonadota bacterium]|jgi:hypothetical protein
MITTVDTHKNSEELTAPRTPDVAPRELFMDAVERVTPEITSRSAQDSHLRALLIAEPELIIKSFIARETGAAVEIPADLRWKVVEDTATVVNLVVPAEASAQDTGDHLSSVLAAASNNADLRRELREAPKATLEATLTRLTGEEFSIQDEVSVVVHEPSRDEIVLVLPPQLLASATASEAYEGLFDQPLKGPMMLQTDPCDSRAFTMCSPSCGLK